MLRLRDALPGAGLGTHYVDRSTVSCRQTFGHSRLISNNLTSFPHTQTDHAIDIQLGIVTYFYVASYRTVKNLVHRHLKTAQPHPGLAKVSARIRNRLFKYTLVFCIIWGLDALFMYMYIFRGPKTNPNTRIILQTVW